MKSAYIHIPFCEHICHYCDFNKFFIDGQPVDEYLDMLLKEMEITIAENCPTTPLSTIFVGGGTPTALNEHQLKKLCEGIRTFLPFEDGEFTFEANPGDLSKEKLHILRSFGVNRLRFGVQAFNDQLLTRIGRTHRVDDVYVSIDQALSVGFKNISIDLIYRLPGQTEEDFAKTLELALELQLPHYSVYSLIVEPKTIFYNLMSKGKLSLPSEDNEAEMYKLAMQEMERKGLKQYEISNFAIPGYESKHNLTYWNNEEYYGFGAGAHAYVDGTRKSNYGPLKKYMEPLKNNKLPTYESHIVTNREKMEEEIFLGLRKNKGVHLNHFNQKYGRDIFSVFAKPIETMQAKGLLQISDGYLRLTSVGKFLGNEVFQAFLH